MRKIILFLLLAVLVVSGESFAQGRISDGRYAMSDGKMDILIDIKSMPDGKYFIEGGGASKQGGRCMMNGMGEFKPNGFEFGYQCVLSLKIIDAGKFELKDAAGCVPCDPGASVSGTYIKK